MAKGRDNTNIIRTLGVVLRYTNFKEADRMLTLFTPYLGKLSVVARGCRKPKSMLLSSTQLFSYGEYILYKKRDLYILNQAEVEDSFFDIRNDMEKLAYSSYILNLTEEAANTYEGNNRLFHLLLQTLSYLAYSDLDPRDITHVFEIKLIDLLGYRPRLDSCIYCGGKPVRKLYFSTTHGGLICPQCYNKDRIGNNIQMGTVQTIRHIMDMDMRRINILKFTDSLRDELDRIIPAYLEERLEKKFKSREFIEQIRKEKDMR